MLSETKISNFVGLILNQYVCRFDIPMNDLVFIKIFISCNYLFRDVNDLSLREFLAFIQYIFK